MWLRKAGLVVAALALAYMLAEHEIKATPWMEWPARILGWTVFAYALTIVLWFQMTMIFLSLPGTFVSGAVLPRGADWLWLAGVGLFGQAGQVFLTEGLRRTPAGRASLANPLVILFGAAIGWLLFHENLDWGDLLGAALLVFGLIFSGSAPRNAVPRSSAS